jgi:threonine dehydratase
MDYLERILNARVYDVAIETPLEPASILSARIGNRVLLKREDMQPVFSFKLRGAYNKIVHLTPAQRKRGVICASAGNHAQGVALAAQKLGIRAVIVMPTTTPQIKIDAVKKRGGEVVLAGDSYDAAYTHALELEKKQKLNFVHPFDDPDVIAGQGTIGMEILRQHPDPIEAVFCCVGGGGLISGVAAYIKRLRPEIKVIGVEAADADAMDRSLKAGKRVRLESVVCSPTVRRSSMSVPRPSACAVNMSTKWSWSTPTPSVPRSRTCSRTRVRSSSRPARSPSPAPRPGRTSTACKARRWWRWLPAPT